MKTINLIAAAMLTSAVAGAATPWSLDSCITYALNHDLTIAVRDLDIANARQSVTEAKDGFLPQLSGQAGHSFSYGRGLTSNNTYANRNTQNFNVGVGLNLPLFQGLKGVRRLDYAKANLASITEQYEAEKDNVELNVITLYLQVLYADEVAQVADEQLRMSKFELERRRTLVEAGKLPELDIVEAEAQVASDEANVVTSRNDYESALLNLAQQLRVPATDVFDIVKDASITASGLLPATEVIDNAMRNNHGLLAQKAAIDAASRNISLAETGYIPTLSFNAGLNTNYYRLGGEKNPAFRNQMRDNFSKYFGFSLNVPIFDAFGTRNSIRRAKLQKTTAELQYQQHVEQLSNSIAQAELKAKSALKKFEAAKVSQQANLLAFDGMREKYNYGKATSADYEQSRSNYIRSQLEVIQARYEYALRCRILEFYNRH